MLTSILKLHEYDVSMWSIPMHMKIFCTRCVHGLHVTAWVNFRLLVRSQARKSWTSWATQWMTRHLLKFESRQSNPMMMTRHLRNWNLWFLVAIHMRSATLAPPKQHIRHVIHRELVSAEDPKCTPSHAGVGNLSGGFLHRRLDKQLLPLKHSFERVPKDIVWGKKDCWCVPSTHVRVEILLTSSSNV